jgi:hypothetical protein
VQDAKFKMQDFAQRRNGAKMRRDTGFRMQDARALFYPASCILHPENIIFFAALREIFELLVENFFELKRGR